MAILKSSFLKSFVAGFIASATLTFIKLKKQNFTSEKTALDKDMLFITKDKNTAKFKFSQNANNK